MKWIWKSPSCAWLFASPWTIYSPCSSPGQNTGVGSLSLLQGIFPTQGSNTGLPYCRQILYQLNHKGSPSILEWVAYFFSSGSSRPRNLMGVSCITRGSLPTELSEIMIITILTSPWILQLCLFLNFLFLKSNHEIWVLSCLDCPFSIKFVKFIHVLVCSARHYFSLLYSIPIKTLECIYPFKCWWLYRCISTRGLSWIKFPGHFLYIPFSKHRRLFLLGINTRVEVSGYYR